jgi:hypothetical protein
MSKELINDNRHPIVDTLKPIVPVYGLFFSLDTATVGYAGGVKEVKLTAVSVTELTAECDASWVMVSLVEEEGGWLLSMNVSNNSSNSPREAVVTVKGMDPTGFPISATLALVQNAYSPDEVDIVASFGESLVLPYHYHTAYFQIPGLDWDSITLACYSDWITFSRDIRDRSYFYTVKENAGVQKRKAVLYVTHTGNDGYVTTKTFSIVQNPKTEEKAIIIVGSTFIEFGYEGGEAVSEFTLQNLDAPVSAVVSEEWITLNNNKYGYIFESGNLMSPLYINVAGHTGSDTRTGTIDLVSGGIVYATITVSQIGKEHVDTTQGYVLENVTCGFNQKEGRISVIDINMGGVWTSLESDVDWIGGEIQAGDTDRLDLTVSSTPDGLFIAFGIDDNLTGEERTGRICLKYKDSNGNRHEAVSVVTQKPETLRYHFPIWKNQDIVLKGDTGTSIEWILTANGSQVYKARGYFDADGKLVVRLNDVLRYYMDTVLHPLVTDVAQDSGGYLSGVLAVGDGLSGYVTECEYVTWNDCSYVNSDDRVILSDPIETVFDSRQLIPVSFIGRQGETILSSIRRVGVTNRKKTDRFSAYNAVNTVMFDMTGYSQLTVQAFGIESDELQLSKKDSCATHSLIYLNAYGGFDSLLVKGKTVRTDNITTDKYTRTREASSHHSVKVLKKEISASWTLFTHYLTERQSMKMHHLLESTLVWLHDLESGEMIPVNITNEDMEYKTMKNGDKKIYYEIKVTEADVKYRL